MTTSYWILFKLTMRNDFGSDERCQSWEKQAKTKREKRVKAEKESGWLPKLKDGHYNDHFNEMGGHLILPNTKKFQLLCLNFWCRFEGFYILLAWFSHIFVHGWWISIYMSNFHDWKYIKNIKFIHQHPKSKIKPTFFFFIYIVLQSSCSNFCLLDSNLD